MAGHVAMIATQLDNKGTITTLQFARDIEQVGGGIYAYHLATMASSEEIYILRPTVEAWCESCSLGNFLSKIDKAYALHFPNGPTHELGDARLFLNKIKFYYP